MRYSGCPTPTCVPPFPPRPTNDNPAWPTNRIPLIPPRSDSREPNWERAALERIALAAVKEQRARRWKIFFRFAFLAVFVLFAFALIDFSSDSKFSSSGRHTALVTIDGEIAAGVNANADDINTALDAAFDDDGTAGVVLRINSPGAARCRRGWSTTRSAGCARSIRTSRCMSS